MPEKKTIERAKQDKRAGKAPSTQAGEFVREEMEHIREGKHGAKDRKQAVAIGLSKARRAGVKLPPPKEGTTSEATREKAKREMKKAASTSKRRASTSKRRAAPKRAEATKRKRVTRAATSPRAGSRQGRKAAPRRKRASAGTARRRSAKASSPE